jgi:hypothetical protein
MCNQVPTLSRRQCLAQGKTLLLVTGAICLASHQVVWASTKADKRDFYYQDKPKDGKSCSTCRMFTSAAGGGVCAIVDGEVSPNGWCMAYSSRAP